MATDATEASATEPRSTDAGATEARPAERGGSGPGARGAHDWHSEAYVRQWVDDNEARAEARRPLLDLLADLIPFDPDASLRILDLGGGWGPVTRHLLARFPAARATILDYSAPMLAEARARLAPLGDRVRFLTGDLSQPGALNAAGGAAGGPFQAVVSSSCLHNLRPTERIPVLYREIRGAVAPGGCFLNLDLVGTGAPEVQAAWHRALVEQARRRRLAETGSLPSFAEAEAALAGERRRHAPPPGGADGREGQPTFASSGGMARSLLDHLRWLREAGFDAVECFWRQDNRALLGAYLAVPA